MQDQLKDISFDEPKTLIINGKHYSNVVSYLERPDGIFIQWYLSECHGDFDTTYVLYLTFWSRGVTGTLNYYNIMDNWAMDTHKGDYVPQKDWLFRWSYHENPNWCVKGPRGHKARSLSGWSVSSEVPVVTSILPAKKLENKQGQWSVSVMGSPTTTFNTFMDFWSIHGPEMVSWLA
jgi:hypothetical protein